MFPKCVGWPGEASCDGEKQSGVRRRERGFVFGDLGRFFMQAVWKKSVILSGKM